MSSRSSRAVAVAFVTFAAFTDLVAYAVAIPVLPDLSRRLGASPTVIGLVFGSFGITLLGVSIPAGAISDRTGRKAPLVGGMAALAAATLLFAFADSLPWLFAARLVQGAADAITWVVGFALIADLYGHEERGRMAGIVMSGTSVAVIVGPTLGGWLYELGGIRMPFVAVTVLAAVAMLGFIWLKPPPMSADREIVPIGVVLRTPSVLSCAVAVVIMASTISMLEPVLALHLGIDLGLPPSRIGTMFGVAAVATMLLNPIYGRWADRWGARRLMILGLMLMACMMPLLSLAQTFPMMVALFVAQASVGSLAITPSLAYMGDATSEAGIGSFGVSYGLFNMAWGVGLLGGPALGGFLFERVGFAALMVTWSISVVAATLLVARTGRARRVAAAM
jgi:MFS transporter, DHA1 family, solute carrier family 18 (vesicular amine transporter), member 1/2